MSRILKQKPIEEHSLYDASALHMRQNHDSSDDEGPSQSNIDQTRIQSIHLDPKNLSANNPYTPIARISTFNKVRKRPQCKVCGEYGHYKTRCNLNPDKGRGRRRRVPLLIRDGKPVMPGTGSTNAIRMVSSDYEDSFTPNAMNMPFNNGLPTNLNINHNAKNDSQSSTMEPVINKYVSLAHFKDDLWDARYQALVKYGEENGTCNVPYTYRCDLPDGTNTPLGQWLQDQRKEKRYGNLRPDRYERLNALVEEGLLDWRPTRYDEKKWITRFEAVVAYANEHGNCEMPTGFEFTLHDGSKIDLAKWFSTEITELRSGRMNPKRESMIQEHLVAPGYLHEENLAARARPRKQIAPDDPLWQAKFEALLAFAEQHGGDYNVPRQYSYVDPNGKEVLLGWWLHYQRTEHRKGTLRKDREEKLLALMEHGFRWDASYHSTQWEKRYEALLRFYEEFKTCNVPHSYKFREEDGSIVALGRWLEKQRRSKKLKTLSPDREGKLQLLVDEGKLYWEIYDAERRSRSWQDKFNLLVAYGDMNGTCELPDNAVITTVDENSHTKKVQLGHWLAVQKHAKANSKMEADRLAQFERLVAEGKLSWEIDPNASANHSDEVTDTRIITTRGAHRDYDDSDDDQAYVHNIYNISAQQAAVSDPLQASHGVSTHPTIVIPIMSEPNEDNRNKRPLHYLRNNAIPSADDIDDDDESEDYEDNEGTDDVMFAKTQPNLKRRKT